MEHSIRVGDSTRADDPASDRRRHDGTHEVAPDLAYKLLMIANVVMIGERRAGDREWILVDTGVPGMAGSIVTAADERFGGGARPAAIVMTHGHFDHAGNLRELAERWDAPVYAHELELPYLNGTASYPPPDPGVGGGILSPLSSLFPRGPVDVSRWLQPLPEDGTIQELPGWRWLHTPGHSAGHVSLWRPTDRSLIAGDAFITTAQESAYAVMTQALELHGPPMYFTHDWERAKTSVELLASLAPEVVITGHGRAMHGSEMRNALFTLAEQFDRIAVPSNGKYVDRPANVESGAAYVRIGGE